MTIADAAIDEIHHQINDILRGGVDPHVHSGPSIAPRALDHLELARQLSEAGFIAAVTKDHDYSGVVAAQLIRKHHPALTTQIYSSIVLNNVVGGLNPYAVEHTAALGGKNRMASNTGRRKPSPLGKTSGWAHPASTQKMRPATAVPLFDAGGKMLPELLDVLDVIAANDMVLASGHIHVSETGPSSPKRGSVASNARSSPTPKTSWAPHRRMPARLPTWEPMSNILWLFLDGSKFQTRNRQDFRSHIDAVGTSRTILCSDLGQVGTYSPLDGFRRGVATCLELGYRDGDIHDMVAQNAADVLGLNC